MKIGIPMLDEHGSETTRWMPITDAIADGRPYQWRTTESAGVATFVPWQLGNAPDVSQHIVEVYANGRLAAWLNRELPLTAEIREMDFSR